jgi:hypothetical protein
MPVLIKPRNFMPMNISEFTVLGVLAMEKLELTAEKDRGGCG